MLKEYYLTAEEIIYLCALAGTKEIAGVEDIFMSVPEEEMVEKISKIKSDLTDKNYMVMDFNGDFAPDDDVSETIDVLSNPDKTIAFYMSFNGSKKYGMIYIKADVAYLSERTEDIYHIKLIETEDILPYLSHIFNGKSNLHKEHKSIIVKSDVLARAKEEFLNKKVTNAKNILKNAGLEDKIVSLILSSYKGKADCLSVKCDNLNPADFSSNGMIVIFDGEIALNFTFDPISEDDSIIVNYTDSEAEESTLNSLISNCLIDSFISEE